MEDEGRIRRRIERGHDEVEPGGRVSGTDLAHLHATIAEQRGQGAADDRRLDADGHPACAHALVLDREGRMSARVVIVEDHGLIAETVGKALGARNLDVHVVHATSVTDVVADVRRASPDVVLLDLDLGDEDRDGADLVPQLAPTGAAVVMLTGVTDEVRLARCVRAGAVGVLSKSAGFDRLVAAVRQVLDRGTLLSPHEREEHLALLRRHERDVDRRLHRFRELTPREAEILRSLCHGVTVDQIAAGDQVSVSTVRTQVRAIRRKLGVSSQLAATALARDSGWLDAP